MKRFLFITKFLILLGFTAYSGELVYPGFLIPDTLKTDANAVIRNLECTLTVNSGSSASYSIKKVVTIFNQTGDRHGIFFAFYDDLRKASGISIKIYDVFGKLIEKVRASDIKDYSAGAGFSLYEDDRIKVYEPVINSYPYTVVSEVTYNYNGFLQFPRWQPQSAPDLSVSQASFCIQMHWDHKVRWLQRNISLDPEIIKNHTTEKVTWVVNTIPAFKRDAFQPPLEEITPNVIVAPAEFSYDGYKGNLSNWQGYGKWINVLLMKRDELPEETILKMNSMVAETDDTIEKIQLIYDYVQQQTRYVSIQYGIGGFQPFKAKVVDEVGYGDCKALTNYTRALLRSVGIESVYTLVCAGRNADEIITDFASQQFNHVILHVPLTTDTIWLECTSQHIPFGYLGKFTSDRTALAITGDGAELIKTKSYENFPGVTSCRGNIEIDVKGNGNATIDVSYTGLNYDEISNFIHDDKESQKKWLYENFYISNASIEEFSVVNKPDMIPSATISMSLILNKYAGKSGKRLFIPLNKIDAILETPPSNDERKFDIYIRNKYIESDTIEFTIPDGYTVEHLPSEVELDSRFGYYSSSTYVDGRQVIYLRHLKVNKGVYPAEAYEELYQFYKSIVKSDKAKLVLIINE